MATFKDSFVDLERHRTLLEDAVSKQRNSLLHWQNWLLEYAALKEEVDALRAPVSREGLAQARDEFEGELVNEKELADIFGENNTKSAEQVSRLLARRIEYVEQNLATLQKQLEVAENKLAAATIVAHPDVRDEEGLPITDIIEDLDDDDNVVSYRLQTSSDSKPQVLEALKKAGFEHVPETAEKPEPRRSTTSPPHLEAKHEPQPESAKSAGSQAPISPPSTGPSSTRAGPEPKAPKARKPAAKKSVSFAEDAKPGHDADPPRKSRAAQRLEQVLQAAREQEALGKATPVIPDDEAVEDAQLRREMLEYGRSEIGPIVAELELEEGDSEDDDDDEQYSELTESGDEEDEYGLSRYSVVTDDYRRQMEDLQRKLGVQSSFDIENSKSESGVGAEGVGRVSVVAPAPGPGPADAAGVAQDVEGSSSGQQEPRPVPPLGDVIERMDPSRREPGAPSVPQTGASRFRTQVADQGASSAPAAAAPAHLAKGPRDAPVRFLDEEKEEAPSGPEGHTMSDTIVERQPSAQVREPDELEASLLQQEVATEYYRLRNRRILADGGGFMKEDQSPVKPLPEEEGGPKRMSRFRAARLSKQ